MSDSTPTSRVARIEQLLDAALDKVAEQIAEGPVSASLLREVVALAKSAGIEIGKDGQTLTTAFDPILESMKDIDPDLFLQ